jgi:catechol 2,3-dioxygenase-like lactoylglutathione lyase family enzyme
MLEKVFYTSVLVSDQDKAIEFYTNVLGLEKRVENPTPDGPRFVTVGVKGDDFQLVLWPGTPGQAELAMGRPPASITIETDDIRKTFEELKSRGAEFVSDVLESPGATSRSSRTPTATGSRSERAASPQSETAKRFGRAWRRRPRPRGRLGNGRGDRRLPEHLPPLLRPRTGRPDRRTRRAARRRAGLNGQTSRGPAYGAVAG